MKYITCIFICLFIFSTSSFAQNPSFPNVVVILADDIGPGDISAYREKYAKAKLVVQTPNIDQLLNDGIHFTDAHSPAALCAPSRYSIMSGNYPYRSYAPWGVWSAYAQSPLRGQLTLAQLMKKAGYYTGFFGKWHMGGGFAQSAYPRERFIPNRGGKQFNTEVDITQYIADGPNDYGFDYSYTFPAGIQAEPYAAYENGVWLPYHQDSEVILINQENAPKGVKLDKKPGLGDSKWNPHHAGPLLVNKALDFIYQQSGKKQPFFIYYASQAVHKPHTPPQKLNEVSIAGSTPVKHLDMVKELDVQIGMLIASLKEVGVYENTLIIFTSDNGGLGIKSTISTGHDSSNGYRGSKNQIYEGGHRVPFIAVWPDRIKAKSVSDEPIIGLDMMAALADLTNQILEDNQGRDSFNILPLMLGKSKARGRKSCFIQGGTSKKIAYRKGNLKLIIQLDHKDESVKTPVALFDLEENPKEIESKNLIHKPAYQNTLAQMFKEFVKIRFNSSD